MGLQDTLEELRNKAANEPEIEETEEEIEEAEETEEEDPVEQEEKIEEVSKEEEKPDNVGHARLRRDKAAAEKRVKELEERVAAIQNPQPIENTESPQISPEMVEIIQNHRISQAEREFQMLEGNFRATVDNYDAVADQYQHALAHSIRIQNPRLSPIELANTVKQTILMKASQFANKGYDPVEELYNEALELGFTGQKAESQNTVEEKRPDLNKVAANRQRNAGMAGAKGRGTNPNITRQSAATMTSAEWSKIPSAERQRIMRGQ